MPRSFLQNPSMFQLGNEVALLRATAEQHKADKMQSSKLKTGPRAQTARMGF
jgi:hypothetical protein